MDLRPQRDAAQRVHHPTQPAHPAQPSPPRHLARLQLPPSNGGDPRHLHDLRGLECPEHRLRGLPVTRPELCDHEQLLRGYHRHAVYANGASEYNCGGFCFTNPTVVQNPAGTQPNPLANLTSPGQNALWLASQQLKTFTAASPGCGTSSHIAYNANAFFGQQGFADNPTGVYCPDLGPGIYQGVTLWLNNAQNNLGTGYSAGPYILDKGMIIGDPTVFFQGNNNPPPNVTAQTGTLLDLEGDSIQADGSFSGASYSFSAAVGGPYSGISIFQPATNATPLSLNLNGTLTTNGLVYVPGATVQATAQFFGGTAILNSLIAKDLTLLISFDVQIGGLALPGPTVASPLYPNFLGQGRRAKTSS